MAARFCDGMQHYPTADITRKWTANLSGCQIIPDTTGLGGNNLFIQRTFGGTGSVSQTIDYQSTWIVGFRLYTPHSNSGLLPFAQFYALWSGNGFIYRVVCGNDSTIYIQPNGTNVVGSTPFKLNSDTWYYIEIKTVLTNDGTNVFADVTLRVDGNTLITTGSFNCNVAMSALLSGTSTANRHTFGATGIENGGYLRDIYILDGNVGATTANNDFLGDVTISAIYPDGDTASIDFSLNPNTGTHFSKVNETSPDDDSTYVYSNTVTNRDEYTWQDIASFSGTIPFVQYLICARKDDAGPRAIQHTVGGSAHPATDEYVNMSWVYYIQIYDRDPATAIAWSVADFNAQTFGVKVTV